LNSEKWKSSGLFKTTSEPRDLSNVYQQVRSILRYSQAHEEVNTTLNQLVYAKP
jgi:hypothetical protein